MESKNFVLKALTMTSQIKTDSSEKLRTMRNLSLLFFVLALAISCSQPHHPAEPKSQNLESLKEVLKQTDLAFSNLSKAKGRNISFIEYMDEDVAMLRPDGMPLLGRDTMQKRFAGQSDTSYTLTWEPLFADVAASGDLGYTYGTWLLVTTKNDSSEGTYCTIWKPQANGDWKFVLDMGNEGLKSKE